MQGSSTRRNSSVEDAQHDVPTDVVTEAQDDTLSQAMTTHQSSDRGPFIRRPTPPATTAKIEVTAVDSDNSEKEHIAYKHHKIVGDGIVT